LKNHITQASSWQTYFMNIQHECNMSHDFFALCVFFTVFWYIIRYLHEDIYNMLIQIRVVYTVKSY